MTDLGLADRLKAKAADIRKSIEYAKIDDSGWCSTAPISRWEQEVADLEQASQSFEMGRAAGREEAAKVCDAAADKNGAVAQNHLDNHHRDAAIARSAAMEAQSTAAQSIRALPATLDTEAIIEKIKAELDTADMMSAADYTIKSETVARAVLATIIGG